MGQRLAISMLLAVACVGPPSAAAETIDLDDLLARPISPGVLALLLPHSGDPRVAARWAEGLHDPRSPVRAIAARVAGISNLSGLEEEVRESLRREEDLDAAREEVRALGMLRGTAAQAYLLEAARRLGEPIAEVVAETLVRHGGLSGLKIYFAVLRELAPSPDLMAWLIHAGAQADPGAYRDVADLALRGGDAEAWHVLLGQSNEDDVMLDRDSLALALQHDSAPMRGETAWHLVERFSGVPPPDPSVWLSALDAGPPLEGGSGEMVDARFGRRLLGRVLGREAETDRQWIEFLGGSVNSHIDQEGIDGAAAEHLTRQEIRAVKKRFRRCFVSSAISRKRPQPRWQSPTYRIVRTITDFPGGFVPDLVTVTGCQVPSGSPLVVEADLTYDQENRPGKVTMVSEPATGACRRLAIGLLTASLPPQKHLPDPKIPERLVLFLEKGFLERLDEREFNLWPRYLRRIADGTGPAFPKRTRFIPPRYPSSAKENLISGRVIMDMVVNSAGDVRNIRLLKVTQDAFYPPATWAVSRWHYRPATVRGRPIAVNLMVVVDYGLR